MRFRPVPLLISLSAIVAFAVGVLLRWPTAEKAGVVPVKLVTPPMTERPSVGTLRVAPSLNPAAQKSGRADPAAERSAAAAARAAAQAAAEQAAK